MLFVNVQQNFMDLNDIIKVEVAYAKSDRQYVVEVYVARGSTIESVIKASGILNNCPEIDLTRQKIGIFSKPCQLIDRIKDGDRIEIYRSLIIDPKEARRTKAKRPKTLSDDLC